MYIYIYMYMCTCVCVCVEGLFCVGLRVAENVRSQVFGMLAVAFMFFRGSRGYSLFVSERADIVSWHVVDQIE